MEPSTIYADNDPGVGQEDVGLLERFYVFVSEIRSDSNYIFARLGIHLLRIRHGEVVWNVRLSRSGLSTIFSSSVSSHLAFALAERNSSHGQKTPSISSTTYIPTNDEPTPLKWENVG